MKHLNGILEAYKKLKEKNKVRAELNVGLLETLKNCIHKDTIREKIKEVDKDINWNNADDHYYCINILKNLLGE